jgi:hypothetical protein
MNHVQDRKKWMLLLGGPVRVKAEDVWLTGQGEGQGGHGGDTRTRQRRRSRSSDEVTRNTVEGEGSCGTGGGLGPIDGGEGFPGGGPET